MCFVRDSGKCSTNCKCKEIESAKALPKATPMQNPSKLRHLRRTSCLQARHNRSALTVDRIFPFGSPKGDWSNRHVEKDPYPNGRSTRRHEDQLLLVNCHSLRPVSLEQFNSQHWTWQGWSYRLPREHLPGIPGGSPKDGTNYPNTKKNEAISIYFNAILESWIRNAEHLAGLPGLRRSQEFRRWEATLQWMSASMLLRKCPCRAYK